MFIYQSSVHMVCDGVKLAGGQDSDFPAHFCFDCEEAAY